MATTIKDIARRLSISTSTVSYALNGGPRTVPDEVRDRVLEVARELRYRPNRVARSLITRRSYTIGVVPTEPTPNLALTPYFVGVLNGILNTAELLERDVLIFTRFSQDKIAAFADTLMDGRADGLILLAPTFDSKLAELLQGELPYVMTSGDPHWAPNFGCDNAAGVAVAVEHLISLGHRKIGHLAGSPDMVDGKERAEAYRATMQAHNLPVEEQWVVQGGFTQRAGYDAGSHLLRLPSLPTAVFCANDESAIGLVDAANELGIHVPKQLSVVGFDGSPISAAFSPSITTVRQPLEAIGSAAMSALVHYVDSQQRPDSITFKTELIVRATSCRPQEDIS